MLSRNHRQARYGMQIRGITKERHWTDFASKDEDDNLDQHWLDAIEFRSQRQTGEDWEMPFTVEDPADPIENPLLENSADSVLDGLPFPDSGEDLPQSTKRSCKEMLSEAVRSLTDKQAIALWLKFGTDLTQREAAAYMGVPQSVFHESIYGKDGVGGAIRKIRNYFKAHPIAQP